MKKKLGMRILTGNLLSTFLEFMGHTTYVSSPGQEVTVVLDTIYSTGVGE